LAYEFRLPDIGEGLAEAEVVRWLVEVGSAVDLDQPLVEVETDKAVVEIPAPRQGVILHHGAPVGAVLEVGAVLAVIGEPGETWGEGGGDEPSTEVPGKTEEVVPATKVVAPIVGSISEEAEVLGVTAPVESPRPQALPLVRKLARELGVDLAAVAGSGPGGRVTRDDVVSASQPDGAEGDGGDERVRLSKLRRTIAERMTQSWREIPHVTTFDQVDAGRLLAARQALAERHQRVLPIDALVAKAVIPVLASFPEFNATLEGDELILHRRFDLGFAVDMPDGLVVARCQDADKLGLMDLAGEVSRLAEGAKARTLRPDELTGQTFSISNIGAVGGGYGTPIIPYGTTAILSVGRAQDKPVVRDGTVVVAPMIPLSLSYDHRVIDGGLGRRFMAQLIENLEEPALFLAG
jgi:pyruvate/2-oxoglutarate dehydrogenase complex dihydrolipoamide acyltransferase (E2) component